MRFCLAVASVLLAGLLCEAALRLFLPKYRGIAEGQLAPDDMRIFAPLPNTRDWRAHPDTGRRHPFHTNNLGLRQHRDFSDADLVSTTTVGVFGDSYTQAPTLDAPYVFTEPLDYLLNQDGQDGNFTVLNFGVDGYGPAQSYFAYRSFPARERLDYVLFVYFGGNDLPELVHNRLFDLDDGGRLRQSAARGSAWWVPFVSGLHLTYLALDATGSLAPYIAGAARNLFDFGGWRAYRDLPADLLDHGLEVFEQLIRRWRREVEESGGKFFVVLLPTQPRFPRVRPLLAQAGAEAWDLNACFESRDDGHRHRKWWKSPYRFEKDSHWNELGNRLAAACLDERLRRAAGLPARAEAVRDAALAEYYAAFESPSPLGRGESTGEWIRRKYQAFGGLDADARVESYLSSDDLAIDSDHYDVYFDGYKLVFVKDDCHADGPRGALRVRMTPVAAHILPRNKSYFRQARRTWLRHEEGRQCVAMSLLPLLYRVSHIQVSQQDGAAGVLWSGEIFIDRIAFEKTLEEMIAAAGGPVIESDMDVHIHGRRIFYVSDDCAGTDGRTPFFLHVTPMHEGDLPADRREAGYDNLDFHEAGVTLGERCVVRWQLPEYPIRRIRTGQYVAVRDGEELLLHDLWEGEADIGESTLAFGGAGSAGPRTPQPQCGANC